MNSNDDTRTAATSTARGYVRSSGVPLALLCFALSLGLPFAADTPVEVCKKKATTDYRIALRQCELSDRGLRPLLRNCRTDAKASYDTALRRCFTVEKRKSGEGQRDFLCDPKCPPPPPPPPPDPKPK